MARSAKASALTLAQQVNGLREGELGFDKLKLAIGNRIGIAAGAAAGPALREAGGLLGWAADKIERNDPGGKNTERVANWFHNNAGYAAGWIGGLIRTGSLAGARRRTCQADIEDIQADRKALANKPPPIDGWSREILTSQNLPALKPARPFKP